jgi:hypothetical protein
MSNLNWPLQPTGGPMIILKPDSGSSVKLPCPGNITWSDGHTFANLDLTSTLAGKVMGATGTEGAITKDFLQDGAHALGNLRDQIASLEKGDIKSGSAKALELIKKGGANGLSVAQGGAFGDEITAASLVIKSNQKKAIFNPQTRTLYKGSSVRTFSFAFLLVPRTQEEANTIAAIHKHIRLNSYPKAKVGTNNMILEYPPLWDITFNGIINQPEIMKCFLTGFDTTFNPSATIWREDGNPVEIAMSANFTETRPPFRDADGGFFQDKP